MRILLMCSTLWLSPYAEKYPPEVIATKPISDNVVIEMIAFLGHTYLHFTNPFSKTGCTLIHNPDCGGHHPFYEVHPSLMTLPERNKNEIPNRTEIQ